MKRKDIIIIVILIEHLFVGELLLNYDCWEGD